MDASPKPDMLRRVRVQARQCYVYAHAAHLGWHTDAQVVADHGWDYLTTKGMGGAKDHGFDFAGIAHLLNPDGSVNDGWRDTYAQAFLVLASAWRYRAFGDKNALDMLTKTTAFLEQNLRSAEGGFLEGIPAKLPRRQNPHMHLFEAFIAAYEATYDEHYLDLSREVYALFDTKFLDEETGLLREFFTQDWKADPKTGHLTEPGHLMEWAWLLHRFEEVCGADTRAHALRFFEGAHILGQRHDSGLLMNEIALDGTPTNTSARVWPQTEYIKAAAARAALGIAGAKTDCAEMIDRMFTHYLDTPVLGGWHDERDENGHLTNNEMSSSTFYHIFCAATEVAKLV